MNDITATLACAAIDYIDVPLRRRQEIGELYRSELANLEKIKLINYKNYWKPNYQIFPIHVENRQQFAEYMWNLGIQVNVNNRRNDIYEIFGGLCDLPNTKRADEDVILLPLHSDLTDAQVQRIIEAVKQF